MSDVVSRLARVAQLTLTDRAPARSPEKSHPTDAHERPWLAAEGLITLADALDGASSTRIAEGVCGLVGAGCPATFVFAFDEPWLLAEHVRARVSALLGHRYVLVRDVWAWRIEPGRGRGWPPHRGVATQTFDRSGPQFINAWVALSDVETNRSCMHFVPLDEDPGYPDAMDRCDAPLERARAVPARAGTALLWNANVLHWGGACSARAAGPRVSCSFSLCRADAVAALGVEPLALADLDLGTRIDLLAEMLLTYGEDQPDVSAESMAWANAHYAKGRSWRARARKHLLAWLRGQG